MPPIPFYRHCVRCNLGFSTFEGSKIYCGDRCELRDKLKKQANESPINKKTRGAVQCLACGSYFVGHLFRDYCNAICCVDGNNERKRQETFDKKQAIEKSCPGCRDKFITYKNNVKYCSKICADKVNRENLDKRNAKRKEDNEKAGKKRKKIPYHVLNLMAEKRRLSEDWDRLTH